MSSNQSANTANGSSKPSLLPKPKTLTRSALNSSVASLASEISEKSNASSKRTSSSTEVLSPNSEDLKIGDQIFVNDAQSGIRFPGETKFTSGNDGSMNGVRQFECKPKYGLFIRPVKAPTQLSQSLDKFETESVASTTKSVPRSTTSSSSYLKIGDRVVVNANGGLKGGVLRFLGETEFATGVWAGVELDDNTGKNDGSVAGKRYFECDMKRGLFAPTNKVSKAIKGGDTVKRAKTPMKPLNSSTYRKTKPGDLLAARNSGLSASQESLNSIASSVSQRSGRIKLGVTSLNNPGGGSDISRKSTIGISSVSSPSTAIRETLKEKENHISQLLNERESERSETAKLTLKIDRLERELALLKNEHQRYIQEKVDEIQELKQTIEEGNNIQKELLLQIEEERRKAEVYEFRLEEEMVNSMEIKEEMEKLIDKKGGHKNDRYELQEEFIKKAERILQLETNLESKKQEVISLHGRIREVEEQCKTAEQKQMRYLETIDELNLKIVKSDNEARKVETIRRQLEEELEQVREDLMTLRSKLSKNDDVLELSDKLRKKDAEISDISSNAKLLQKQLQFLNDEKSTFEEERKESERVVREMAKEIDKLQRVNMQLREDLSRFEEQKYTLERDVEEQCKTAEHNQTRYLETIDELNAKIVKSENEARKAETIRSQLEEELENLREDLVTLRNQLSKNDDILELTNKLKKKDAEICDISNNMILLQKELQFLKGEKSAFAEERNESERIVREMVKEIDKLQCVNNQLREDLIRFEEQKHALERQIEEQCKTAEQNQMRYLETIDELNLKIVESDNEKRKLETIRHKLEEELELLREDLVTLRNKLSKNDDVLVDKLRKKDAEICDISNNANLLQKELQFLNDEKSTFEEERKESERIVREMVKEIDKLQLINNQLREELNRFEEQKYALERQVEEQCKTAEEHKMRYLETIDELNLKIVESDNETRKAETIRRQLEEELELLREDLVTLRNKLSKNDDVLELTDKLKKKYAEISDISSSAKLLQKQLQFLNDENSTFDEERKESEGVVQERVNEIDKLQCVNMLREELIRFEEQKYALERQDEEMSRKRNRHASHLNMILNEIVLKEDEIRQLLDDLG